MLSEELLTQWPSLKFTIKYMAFKSLLQHNTKTDGQEEMNEDYQIIS